MTGAAIVRREADDEIVLAVYGAFDGASAWALRIEMDAARARAFVIDLAHAVEACEFAACVLAGWARERRREKRLRFRPGTPEHVRLLAGFGLEVEEREQTAADEEPFAAVEVGPPLGRIPPLAERTAVV
jgi:hypothetical protein